MKNSIMPHEQAGQEGRTTWARRLLAWSAVVSYCGLLYYLSDQPGQRLPDAISSSDVLAHMAAYAVLGWLWTLAFRETWGESSPQAALLFALIFSLGYGLGDEWHQSFVSGRVTSVADVVADVVGGGLGAGCFFFRITLRTKRKVGANAQPPPSRPRMP